MSFWSKNIYYLLTTGSLDNTTQEFSLARAKRASNVITQTNSEKQNGMVEDLKLFQALKQVLWRLFSSCFSQNTLMLSDSREVPITCILFNKLTSIFHASVLLLIMNFVIILLK